MPANIKDINFVARGDSHVREPFFPWNYLSSTLKFKSDSPVKTDQPTLYSVGKNPSHRERETIDKAIKANSKKNVFLTLSCGEIDLRSHIHKAGSSTKDVYVWMDSMVENYFNYLDELRAKHTCVKWLLVYGVIPPNNLLARWMRDPMWGYHPPTFTKMPISFFVKKLNQRLQAAAKKHGCFYFDVHAGLSTVKRGDYSIYCPNSGLQMHLDANNPVVQKVFLKGFKDIIKKM